MLNKIYSMLKAIVFRLLYSSTEIAKKKGVVIGDETVIMNVTFGYRYEQKKNILLGLDDEMFIQR